MTAQVKQDPVLFVLPGRKDEAWKYADRRALEAVQGLEPHIQDRVARALKGRDEVRLSSIDGQACHVEESLSLEGNEALIIHRLEGDGWLNVKFDVSLDGGKLTHIILQDRGAEAVTTVQTQVTLNNDARYEAHVFQIGSLYSRIGFDVALLGEGADFTLNDAQLGKDKQNLETVTRTTHAVKSTTCNQNVRNVLKGSATASFSGKIKVERGADKTDAEQHARSLILDRTATANTKPELEIYADDVKCAHGATVGELDKNALFYLMARGVAPKEAHALLIEAFVADVLSEMPDEATRDAVMTRAQNWMAGGQS